MRKLLIGLLLAAGLGAQTLTIPDKEDLIEHNNSFTTTLSSGINNSTLTIPVTSAAAITISTPGAVVIRIDDNENIKICSKSGNTLTACSGGRGFDGTTAVTHAVGATVRGTIISPAHLNAVSDKVIEIATALGTNLANVVAEADIDTFSELDAIVADESLVNTNDAQTLSNKTIGGGTATTTHAAGANFLTQLMHATDCTAITDGVAGEICLELDSDRFFTCQPTAGLCDTAGEWIETGGATSAPLTLALPNDSVATPLVVENSDVNVDAANSAEIGYHFGGVRAGSLRLSKTEDFTTGANETAQWELRAKQDGTEAAFARFSHNQAAFCNLGIATSCTLVLNLAAGSASWTATSSGYAVNFGDILWQLGPGFPESSGTGGSLLRRTVDDPTPLYVDYSKSRAGGPVAATNVAYEARQFAYNSSSQDTIFSRETVTVDDPTAASEDGTYRRYVTVDGSEELRITANAAGVDIGGTLYVEGVPCINESGEVNLGCLPTSTGVLEWFIRGDDLAVAATSMVQKSLPNFAAGTIVHLGCAACVSLTDCSTAASATINLDARALSALHTAGTDAHTSELTCDQDGFTTTTFSGDPANAANEVWNLSISAVTDATVLRVWATVERN